MFAGYGSQMIAAASTSGSSPFHGTITVSAACASVTPGLAGIAWVASPEPASASSPSTCP
jgi:hypothetical protein